MASSKSPTPQAKRATTDEASLPTRVIVGATLSSVALSLLALYQWMELIVSQHGGETFCSISETINCDTVWNSPFAKAVHGTTGLPVAGWGLLFGLTALGASLRLSVAALKQMPIDTPLRALRLTALVGVVTSLVLIAVTIQLGVLCPTCLVSYALIALLAAFSFAGGWVRLPLLRGAPRALLLPAGVAALAYLALLFPGTHTPLEAPTLIGRMSSVAHASNPAPNAAFPASELGRYLASLPPQGLEMVATGLATMRLSPTVDTSRYPARKLEGAVNAPVKIVDFVDLKCGHCKHLEDVLKELNGAVPPGAFSSEPRYYPLDSACNPTIAGEHSDGDTVRCVAAKALICSEHEPEFHTFRERLFDEQSSFDIPRVYAIAQEVFGPRAGKLEACVHAKDTAETLAQDISYASQFPIVGTPVVLVNGRLASAAPPFLFAMILAQGHVDDPAFRALPPAPPQKP